MSHVAALEAAIGAWGDGGAFDGFEEWALRAFAHQFEHVAAYRAYCERRGVTPGTVESWSDVPAVPAAAFRHVELAAGPAEVVFRTSGTTGGAEARGRHPIVHLSLYRASALAGFSAQALGYSVAFPPTSTPSTLQARRGADRED